MTSCDDPIGIFDSGIGGLTIMREIVKCLPFENMVYFGDTARLPYGDKSAKTILRYTLENVSFLIEQKIKFLVLACFTASSYALDVLQQKLSIPVIGVLQSGFEELMAATVSKRVAILGTSSTIQSGALQSLIQKKDAATAIFSIPCPLLVPMIEEGLVSHPAIKMVVDHYLEQLQGKQVDSALLACTHYPLIRGVIQEAVGRKVRLIEPARLCAKKTKHWLESHSLLNPAREKPVYQFYVSDNPQKFCRFTHQFFGSKIAKAAEPKFVDRLLPEMAPVEKKYDDL